MAVPPRGLARRRPGGKGGMGLTCGRTRSLAQRCRCPWAVGVLEWAGQGHGQQWAGGGGIYMVAFVQH